jgi:hypothetical protein
LHEISNLYGRNATLKFANKRLKKHYVPKCYRHTRQSMWADQRLGGSAGIAEGLVNADGGRQLPVTGLWALRAGLLISRNCDAVRFGRRERIRSNFRWNHNFIQASWM